MAPTTTLAPQNLDAEEAVLAAGLVNEDFAKKWAKQIQPGAFYAHHHGWVWQAIAEITEAKGTADLLSVSHYLRSRPAGRDTMKSQLDECGGEGWLARLTDVLFNNGLLSDSGDTWAHIVIDLWERRQAIAGASTIARVAYDQSAADWRNVIGAQAMSLVKPHGSNIEPKRAVVDRLIAKWEAVARGESDGHLYTGYRDLDALTWGIAPNDFVVLGGVAGSGKSKLLDSIEYNVSTRQRKPVMVFSLEMDNASWVGRQVAAVGSVDFQKVRLGQRLDAGAKPVPLTELDWKQMVDAAMTVSDSTAFMDEYPGNTELDIVTKSRWMHAQHGLSLIVVDYIQRVRSSRPNNSRAIEVGHISRTLAGLAQELGVPVLAAARLNRALEQRSDKRPVLADLAESGGIDFDATQAWFVYRDEMYDPDTESKNIAEVLVRKNKNGPTGRVALFFDKTKQSYHDLARGGHIEL